MNILKKLHYRLEEFRYHILLITDLVIFNFSFLFSNYLRLNNIDVFNKSYFLFYIFSLSFFFILSIFFRFYFLSFKYYNLDTQRKVFKFFVSYLTILFIFVNTYIVDGFPRSLSIIFPLILFLILIFYRLFLIYMLSDENIKRPEKPKTIFIGLEKFVRNYEFLNKSDLNIKYVVTSKKQHNLSIGNSKIINIENFETFIEKKNIKKVIFSDSKKFNFEKINSICKKNFVDLLIYDDSKYLHNSDVKNKKIRTSDFLLRPELFFDEKKWNIYFKNKTVLISGGGGTIGSGIAKFLNKTDIKKIIISDNSEYRLWKLKEELKENYDLKKYTFLLIDFTNKKIIKKQLNNIKVDCVIHAAAYKHVNIVEENIHAAFFNNIISTENLINYSNENNIDKFLLISTDKAVRPTNAMGLSKRICELQILTKIKKTTNFNIVRFGNVFGSSGSLVEIIDKKINENSTLEITNLDAKRYFMSIEEAAYLILDILVNEPLNEEKKIHILDMGKEIRLEDFIINYINRRYNQNIKNLENNDFLKTKIIGLQKGEKKNEILSYGKLDITSFNKKILYEKEIFNNKNVKKLLEKIIPKLDDYDDTIDFENIKKNISELPESI
jgi:UDP-N-acetylglucosamine 4,6-dehydratase